MQGPANRQLHVQGLRAVAVLLVIAYHAGLPIGGGFIGVDVFFVISGYVITAMLIRELDATGRIRFGQFYLRRFKRLTPALALTVTVTSAAAAFILSPRGIQQLTGQTAVGSMLLAANVVISNTTGGYFDAPAASNPLLNMWSLSVEEQFYLLFPAVMGAAWMWASRRGRASHVKAVVAAIGIASFALAVIGSNGEPGFLLGFYSPLTRAWEFAAGALLALLPQPQWTAKTALSMSSVGAGLLAIAAVQISASTPFPGVWTLLPVVSTLALISTAGRAGTPVAQALASRPLVAVGDWSYSLYLWHWPVIVLATALRPHIPGIGVMAALVSAIPALLSYRWVEQPLRKAQFERRHLALVVATTLFIPIAAAAALSWTADHIRLPAVRRATVQFATARALPEGYKLGCHYEPGDGAQDPTPCVWNRSATGKPVYLLGDSNAAQFESGLIDATRALQRPFIATTSSGCPLLDLQMDGPKYRGYGAACRARNLRLLEWMRTQTPGTVVIGMSDGYWYEGQWTATVDGQRLSSTREMVKAMGASLQRVVRSLQSSGHRVIVVQTIPHWTGRYSWDPLNCTLEQSLRGCVASMPLSFAEGQRAASIAAVRQVAAVTSAALLDLSPELCPGGTCLTATTELPVYRDATHITVAMSRALAPVFEAALR